MKRLFSVLSKITIVGVVLFAFAIAASADQANVVYSCDFQAGELSDIDYTCNDGTGVTAIVAEPGNESNTVIKMTGAGSGFGKTVTGLVSGKTYNITFRAKLVSREDNSWPQLGVKKGGDVTPDYGSVFEWNYNSFALNTWNNYSFSYTADADGQVLIWAYGMPGAGFEILYDDIAVVEANANSTGFRYWDLKPGTVIDALGFGYGQDKISLVEDATSPSGYAVKLNGADGYGIYAQNVKPNTKYVLTYWTKHEGAGTTLFGIQYLSSGEQFVMDANETTEHGWVQKQLVFTSPANMDNIKIYTWVTAGNPNLYLTNLRIDEYETFNASKLNFENPFLGTIADKADDSYSAIGNVYVKDGGANGTGKALLTSGVNCGVDMVIDGLLPSTAYEVKFYAKMENRGNDAWPQVILQDYTSASTNNFHYEWTGEWAEYTMEFTTDATHTGVDIRTWVFGTETVDFYIDEVRVIKKYIAPTVAMGATLGNSITANFVLTLNDAADKYTDFYFEAKLGSDEVIKLYDSDNNAANGYTFNFEKIYSQRMTDKITGKFYGVKSDLTEEVVLDFSEGISFAGYCDILYAANTTNDALCTLLANTLAYGSASQKYAGYNITVLADAASWVGTKKTTAAAEAADNKFSSALADPSKTANRIASVALRLENKISMICNLEIADAANVTLSVTTSDESFTKVFALTDAEVKDLGSGKYAVILNELLPTAYDTVYTLKVLVSGNEAHTVTYSVNSYVVRMAGNANLAELVTAIYNYGKAAEAYAA